MYARLISFSGADPEKRENALQTIRETVVPTLREYDGVAKGELERLLGETGKREEQRERELGHVRCWWGTAAAIPKLLILRSCSGKRRQYLGAAWQELGASLQKTLSRR